MLLDKLAESGVRVELDGENLRARIQGGMTDEQRAFIRDHKNEIKSELRSREQLPDRSKARLHNVVAKLAADCASWYRDDAEVIETMGDDDLEKMVLDYLSKRDWYNRQQIETK